MSKTKSKKATFEVMYRLFQESWAKHKLVSMNWLNEWAETRKSNGWNMDEFDAELDLRQSEDRLPKFEKEEEKKEEKKVA